MILFSHLYPCRDEEVCEDGLDFGLAGLEVVPTQEHLLLLRQLDHARNKRVLGGPVDVGALYGGGGGEGGMKCWVVVYSGTSLWWTVVPPYSGQWNLSMMDSGS